ncbi:MAG: polB [Bacteroidetes bacterium]|nr:polB [Bacteroidota bacterium]
MQKRQAAAPARQSPGMHRIAGWLFDLYPSAEGITLWIVDGEGKQHRCSTPFTPSFFLHVAESDAAKVAALTGSLPMKVTFEWTRQREIYTDQEWTVLRVRVHDTREHQGVVKRLERHFPHYVFFNSDIPSPQLFLYETGLFPLARGEYEITQDGLLAGWTLADSPEAVDYSMPPLTTMVLRNRADFVSPKYRKTYQLEVAYDGRTFELEQQEPAALLEGLNRHLRACDPDIILTQYGDAVLLPMLARLAADERVPLPLNRDERAGYFTTSASSYFTYGRIVHRDGAFELAGRWHLDTENSFMMGEASLEGVAEIARMTQLPVQHQSRSSIGSALSSMQLSWAMRHNYLIPAKKREPEAFKTAATLLLADRGGLIFQPVMGYHEQIAEMDFVSMYPTIMVEHNVSPETVNCRCCDNHAVPELGYSICERREGIVPATLRAVVRKRGLYKQQKKQLKAAGDPRWTLYDRRQNALKWMLVTCFGYLGYKNARFGRIEAHESVNAFSRDAILRAKELAEQAGYTFIHAIVDCMWIKKDGATVTDYELLAADVSKAAGIDISLEGIYRWILFPASKMDPRIPTANKYVGWYESNEIKIRGVEMRRRDTPVFIKRMQGEMLQILGCAQSVADVGQLVPEVLAKAEEHIRRLQGGQADPMELVVRRHITREPDGYANRSASAEVAKALQETGITLAPGEMIEYVIVDASGKRKPEKARPLALYSMDDGYDIAAYMTMALKAVETLLLPFGYDLTALEARFAPPAAAERRRRPPRDPGQGLLFEYPEVA